MTTRSLLIVGAVVFALAYIAAPIFMLSGLYTAIKAGNAEKLNQYVDFPAVRASVKEQVSALMLADPQMAGNPFALALGPVMINTVIDNMVTPSGLAAMIQRGKTGQKPESGSQASSDVRNLDFEKIAKSLSISGLDEFRIIVSSEKNEAPPEIVFKNLGVFNWKLSDIRIPPNALAKK